MRRTLQAIGFKNELSGWAWLVAFASFVPVATVARLGALAKPVIDFHPYRQCQTALTIYYFARNKLGFLDYSSPLGGRLWNFVREFPLYQWLCAKLIVISGLPLELVARVVTLAAFALGAVALWHIVRELVDKEAAAWATLLYYASPLTIIFSRTCMVDFFALGFMLVSAWAMLAAWRPGRPRFAACIAIATVAGALAALCKVTVWYAPTLALGVWLLTRRAWIGLASLFVQGVIGIAWSAWSERIYTPTDPQGHAWLFGTLGERLSWASWRILVDWIGRETLYQWTIPFVAVAILCPRAQRRLVAAALFVILLPILVFFHVSINHDYYLIAGAPYLFLLAAIGVKRIVEAPRPIAYGVMGGVLIVGGWRAYKMRYIVGGIFNAYSENVATAEWLKRTTTADDVIFAEVPAGPCAAMYSERLVNLRTVARPADIGATAVYFPSDPPTLGVLDGYSKVALDYRGDEQYLYRVGGDLASYVTASDEKIGEVGPASRELTLCRATVGVAVPEGTRAIAIEAPGRAKILMPARKYLYFPARTAWGCRVSLTYSR